MEKRKERKMTGTTIVAVRKNGKVAIAGDGQEIGRASCRERV